MNIYFLVEGRRTERKVYPRWLSHLLPELTEVEDPFKISNNNFYIFNGGGFPSLLDNHLRNAISDINEIKKFDFLVICLDSDELRAKEREKEVLSFISKHNLKLETCQLVIIVQNKCIETWFLGNRKVYSRQPQSVDLRNYNQFYNVQLDDPSLMSYLPPFSTSAQFHEAYLSEMLREKNISYTKKYPNGVTEAHYLNELIKRNKQTNHIASFKVFTDFCEELKKSIRKKKVKKSV